MRQTLIALGVLVAACAATKPLTWKNLQVLPRDMSHDDLIATMRVWSGSLGVDCEHCHVVLAPAETGAKRRLDFVSDAPQTKRAARAMLRMTRRIDADTAPLAKNGGTVTCYTCHRGRSAPESALPPRPKT